MCKIHIQHSMNHLAMHQTSVAKNGILAMSEKLVKNKYYLRMIKFEAQEQHLTFVK